MDPLVHYAPYAADTASLFARTAGNALYDGLKTLAIDRMLRPGKQRQFYSSANSTNWRNYGKSSAPSGQYRALAKYKYRDIQDFKRFERKRPPETKNYARFANNTTAATPVLHGLAPLVDLGTGSNAGERIGNRICLRSINTQWTVINLASLGETAPKGYYLRIALCTILDEGESEQERFFKVSEGGQSFPDAVATVDPAERVLRLLKLPINDNKYAIHWDKTIYIPSNYDGRPQTRIGNKVMTFKKYIQYYSPGTENDEHPKFKVYYWMVAADGESTLGDLDVAVRSEVTFQDS